jgi:choline trimethylamine-lyase
MREFLPYWKGKSVFEKWVAMIPENALKLINKIQTAVAVCLVNMNMAHVAVDFEKLLLTGLNGIKKQVDKQISTLNIADIKDIERSQFYNAVNITLDAAIKFAERYANLAKRMADNESNLQRKEELLKIAETCMWVPANPARSFYEALQSIWFTYVILMIEGWGGGLSFGRPDQYLYPFYIKDIESEKITKQEAIELIELLYIQMNQIQNPFDKNVTRVYCGHAMPVNITLSGVTREGKDAVNELSYLFLDAEEDLQLKHEDIIIRVSKNTPDAFLIRACEVCKALRGKFKWISDETTIQSLLNDGKPIEYARDYISTGCHNPTVPGISHDHPGGHFNLPLMLELAMNNGLSRLTGERIGSETGDPHKFKSYDDIWKAYKTQVETLMPFAHLFKNIDMKLYAELAPTPFQSSLFQGCIEKGIDIKNGGTAPYRSHAIALAGAPNVGDSLAAIKKTVFEDKQITMTELINALDKNFEGEGKILHILQKAPKFGNDIDYVDSIVNDVLMHATGEVNRFPGFAGAISNAAAMVVTSNIPLGEAVGALPDGRKAGEPLSEGGISPYQGRNTSGPTATMRSVAKLNQVKMTAGSVLNMRFNPDALKDESKIKKFAHLIRTYCETGGNHVQFNIVTADTLRDAQKYPEKYRDLLVRVATYSAYFVELNKDLQNNIIARMEFQGV